MGGVPGVVGGAGNGLAGTAIQYDIKNDGNWTYTGVGNAAWVTPATSAVAAGFQVKLDITGGSLNTGTTGTFLDCSTTRSWTKTSVGVCTFTLTWREKATGIVRKTQTGLTIEVT